MNWTTILKSHQEKKKNSRLNAGPSQQSLSSPPSASFWSFRSIFISCCQFQFSSILLYFFPRIKALFKCFVRIMKFTIRHDLNNLIIREMKTSHFYLIGLFFNSLKKNTWLHSVSIPLFSNLEICMCSILVYLIHANFLFLDSEPNVPTAIKSSKYKFSADGKRKLVPIHRKKSTHLVSKNVYKICRRSFIKVHWEALLTKILLLNKSA